MILLLLQHKWFLAGNSTLGKITVPAILGQASPEKAQQERVVYLHFVSTYNLPKL